MFIYSCWVKDRHAAYTRNSAHPKPKNGYFQIELSNPNYNSIFSLAVVAFVNNYELQVRAKYDIDPNKIATVSYVTLDK